MTCVSLSRWCILRVAGARTLPLARSLQAVGLEAWTPVQRVRRRVPRGKRVEHREVPFTPTYVFASERHLDELRGWEASMFSPHPAFSVFRHRGEVVFIGAPAMNGLRAAEADSQRRADRAAATDRPRSEPLAIGSRVEPKEGAFAGLSGVVQESDGKHTLVLFGARLEVTIGTSLLRRDSVALAPSAA